MIYPTPACKILLLLVNLSMIYPTPACKIL